MLRRTLGWSCALILLLAVVMTQVASTAEEKDAVIGERIVANVIEPVQVGNYRAAESRIKAALQRKLKGSLIHDEEPLEEVLDQISEEYNLPIVMDNAALDEFAISPETEVSIDLQGVTLSSTLDLMLRQPGLEDLCYTIEHEVLMITTKEMRDSYFVAKVYRVDDLVEVQEEFNQSKPSWDYDSLIDMIISCIEMDSWGPHGTGSGEIHALDPGMLVISQTHRVHDMIEELFSKLRQTKSQILADRANQSRQQFVEKPITRGYLVTGLGKTDQVTREQLASAIVRSVEWQIEEGSEFTNDDVWLKVLPERVLVRHLPSVLKQVCVVLTDMGINAHQMSGYSYSGSGFFSTQAHARN